MSDDDTTTVWQRVKPKRREYEGPEKRAPEPTNYLVWLPLALAVLAGVAGYVRTQAKVEVLERDLDRASIANDATHKDLRAWNIQLGERLRDHKDRQH